MTDSRTPAVRRSAGRLLSLLRHPSAPLLIAPILVLGFWLTEALIHYLEFGHRSFLSHLLAPDGHELWMRLLISAALIVIAALWRSAVQEHVRNVAALRAYQRRLHEMTARLAYGDSFERRDLATRLHEDVGQQLVAARMFLSSATEDRSREEASRMVAEILDGSVAACRDVAESLSPPSLDHFGLQPALESLGERIMRRSGVSVEMAIEECPKIDERLVRLTFQVAAEVLEQASHTADTKRISISCREEDEGFSLLLSWDSPASDDFFSADERITRAGGRFSVISAGESTDLSITVPTVPVH